MRNALCIVCTVLLIVETIAITYSRILCLVFQVLGFCDCLNVKISILFWIRIRVGL